MSDAGLRTPFKSRKLMKIFSSSCARAPMFSLRAPRSMFPSRLHPAEPFLGLPLFAPLALAAADLAGEALLPARLIPVSVATRGECEGSRFRRARRSNKRCKDMGLPVVALRLSSPRPGRWRKERRSSRLLVSRRVLRSRLPPGCACRFRQKYARYLLAPAACIAASQAMAPPQRGDLFVRREVSAPRLLQSFVDSGAGLGVERDGIVSPIQELPAPAGRWRLGRLQAALESFRSLYRAVWSCDDLSLSES